MIRLSCIVWATLVSGVLRADLSQGPGTTFDFKVTKSDAPSAWNAELDQNLA